MLFYDRFDPASLLRGRWSSLGAKGKVRASRGAQDRLLVGPGVVGVGGISKPKAKQTRAMVPRPALPRAGPSYGVTFFFFVSVMKPLVNYNP